MLREDPLKRHGDDVFDNPAVRPESRAVLQTMTINAHIWGSEGIHTGNVELIGYIWGYCFEKQYG